MRSFALILIVLLAAMTLVIAVGQSMLEPLPTRWAGDARLGATVFHGRGRCVSCHALDGSGRCPSLVGVAARASDRVPGERAVRYLVESIYEPDAFVVDGYPRGLMPAGHLPPASLTDDEISALVTYLLIGVEGHPDPALVAEIRAVQVAYTGPRSRPTRRSAGDPRSGAQAFARLGCGTCHGLDEGADSALGPTLAGVGATQAGAYLAGSIWSPNEVVIPGPSGRWQVADGSSRMPSYQHLIDDQELWDLVAYLQTLPAPVD